jgi:hypothetical protein
MEIPRGKAKDAKTENPQPVSTGCGFTKQQQKYNRDNGVTVPQIHSFWFWRNSQGYTTRPKRMNLGCCCTVIFIFCFRSAWRNVS